MSELQRVRKYLEAETKACSPTSIIAFCETTDGTTVWLALSDLVAVVEAATPITTTRTRPTRAADQEDDR